MFNDWYKGMIGKAPDVGDEADTIIVLCKNDKSDDWTMCTVSLDKEAAQKIVPIIKSGKIKEIPVVMGSESYKRLEADSRQWQEYQAWLEARKKYLSGKKVWEQESV